MRFPYKNANLPENMIFNINQGYLSHKDNKKIYYSEIFIIGQITPLSYQPKNIVDYVPKEDEVKILRSKYNLSTDDFLGLKYCISFLTVRNDPQEQFFYYGYTKDNSKILYSTQKMKMSNSFKTTMFNKHKIQYEAGAFDTDSSNTFFFIPSMADRIEKINKHLGSVNIRAVDINKNDFGENFNPAALDYMTDKIPAAKYKSVLNVLKKIADYSSQNLKQNADAYLATVPHNSDTLLWPGGKCTQSDKFAFSY